MTETLGPQQAAVGDKSATWYRILRKVGLVYIFSRLCVLAGAAIVAVELQADINQTKGIPNVPFPDPQSFRIRTRYITPVLAPAGLAYRLWRADGTPDGPLRWALRAVNAYFAIKAWWRTR